jgi:hypothetical protein
MRQARPAGRGDGQSSFHWERIVRLLLASIHRIRFPKAEKYTHPRGRKDRNIREKKSILGYGRCIDSGPRHRPLPAVEAAHIRHPARHG